MEYSKPWLTFERQADLLINERGLIADRDCLIAHLADIGYYRLSGYWYNFKRKPASDEDGEKDERFVEGTTFEQVWKLYVFDRQFSDELGRMGFVEGWHECPIWKRHLAYLDQEFVQISGVLQ